MTLLATILGAVVFCAPASDKASSRFYPGYGIVIDHTLCQSLSRAPKVDDNSSIAVYVLAHEEGHAHDGSVAQRIKDGDCNRRGACEAFADCWGVGHIVQVARAARYSARDALRIRRRVKEFLSTASSNYGPIPARCWSHPPKGTP